MIDKINGRHRRVSERMIKELEEIKRERFRGTDVKFPRPISDERLFEGIVRCDPEWKRIKEKLIREKRREDLR